MSGRDGAGEQHGGIKSFIRPTLPRRVLLTVVALLIVLAIGGQVGLLAGKRPADLGIHEGRLKPSPPTPNCVNSQSTEGYSRIAPLAYSGDGRIALLRLHALVARMPTARVIDSRADYIYAEFSSKWLGLVDDVEFYLDQKAGVIHVRSASRLGRTDFGVNRQRIEAIRAALGG